jgi:hypothetical protein
LFFLAVALRAFGAARLAVLFSARMSEANKFDPHRRLCPDGSCIGVIGSDGRCPVCGRSVGSSGGGKDAPAGFVASATTDDVDDDGDGDDAVEAAPANGVGAFDPNRRLCSDGSCVGVIGADGVCNVCGQKAD